MTPQNWAWEFIETALLLALAAAISLAYVVPQSRRREEKPETITILVCPNCGRVRRRFMRGDYVGAKVPCPMCGGEAEVYAVYQVKPKQGKRKR